MHSVLFYIIPIVIYLVVNNLVDHLYWPHFLALLLSFLVFQLVRVRYPKDSIPLYAKITQAAFYVLTVAFIFRDQYLNPAMINILLAVTIGLVIAEIMQNRKKPSK
ncbi:hypothetical protein QMA09_12110 [Planococcus sp. APC 3906]|uniref:hypothetical protein n=1 Tax=Planococcus sp. APC 3906 TaxID=3035194 RepID=UPI0025B36264|nr:hypothetical protein [Planococcus sp. APC 3906]MDN3450932.1 hypothetical protein [Planococcus sp. APC 3906]